MNSHKIAFCMIGALTATVVADEFGAAADADSVIRSALYDKITEARSSKARWAPLTENIGDVFVGPAHPAVFTWQARAADLDDLAEAQRHCDWTDSNAFLVLNGLEVVAGAANGELLLRQSSRFPGHLIVLGPTTSRRIPLPRGASLQRAWKIGGRWLLHTWQGLFLEEFDYSLRALGEFNERQVRVVGKDAFLLLREETISQNQAAENVARLQLNYVYIDGNAQRTLFTHSQGVQGVIRHGEDNWLAIGSPIAPLEADAPAEISDEEILETLELAKNQDLVALAAAMERLTRDAPRRAFGLGRLLAEIPENDTERTGNGRLEPRAIDFEAIRRAREHLPTPATDSPDDREPPASMSVGEVARLLRSGCQYIDGRWISEIRLEEQSAIDRAIISARWWQYPGHAGDVMRFEVTGEGRLTALTETIPFHTACGPGQNAKAQHKVGADGREYVLYPRYGLAVIQNGRLLYCDQSPRMQSIESLIGADSLGYVYLRGSQQKDSLHRGIWRYLPNGEESQSDEVMTIPAVGLVVSAPDSATWFVTCAATPTQAEVEQANVVHTAESYGTHGNDHASLNFDLNRNPSQLSPALYRWERDGTCRYFFSTERLEEFAITPGQRKSALIVSKYIVAFIDDRKIYSAPDLPRLVAQHFTELMQNAPVDSRPIRVYTRSPQHVPGSAGLSWLRVGDVLWVATANSVEAYREGQPLRISDRLALRNQPAQHAIIVGPMGNADGPTILIWPRSEKQPHVLPNLIWATQSSEGIAFNTLQQVSGASMYELSRLSLVASPLLVLNQQAVYFPIGTLGEVIRAGEDGSYSRLPGFGTPLDVSTKGWMLIEHASSNSAPRRVSWMQRNESQSPWESELVRDIKAATIEPVHAEVWDGDAILCRTPTGLAWMEEASTVGNWEVTRRVELAEPPIGIISAFGDGVCYVTAAGSLCRWTPY